MKKKIALLIGCAAILGVSGGIYAYAQDSYVVVYDKDGNGYTLEHKPGKTQKCPYKIGDVFTSADEDGNEMKQVVVAISETGEYLTVPLEQEEGDKFSDVEEWVDKEDLREVDY